MFSAQQASTWPKWGLGGILIIGAATGASLYWSEPDASAPEQGTALDSRALKPLELPLSSLNQDGVPLGPSPASGTVAAGRDNAPSPLAAVPHTSRVKLQPATAAPAGAVSANLDQPAPTKNEIQAALVAAFDKSTTDASERLAPAREQAAPRSETLESVGTGTEPAAAREPVAPIASAPENPELEWHETKVRKGDSLYHIFKRLNLSQADLLSIAGKKGTVKALRKLRPGRKLEIQANAQGRVTQIIYHRGSAAPLLVRKEDGRFTDAPEQAAASRSDGTEKPSVPVAAVPAKPAKEPVTPVASAKADDVQTDKPAPARRLTIVAAPTKAEPAAGATPQPAVARHVESSKKHLAGAGSKKIAIKSGDSLYNLFIRHKASTKDLARLMKTSAGAKTLKRIKPGQTMELFLDDSQSVSKLLYHPDITRTIEFARLPDGSGFTHKEIEHPLDARQVTATGTIDSSLFLAGQRAGLGDNVIMQMAEIFAWDIDFVQDIRRGDSFSVVYEELYQGDKRVRSGNILAAEFVNRGRAVRALRYEHKDGTARYYTPEGYSMRKAFLRSPVNFTRISSRFSRARMHPVLHKVRAHKGVDYAAPRGTPVLASGDGKVLFAGRKNGYGKTVILQHGSTYTTLYAHLHRIKVRNGKRVKQGQVIGLVGSTGMSTGPHLHYEFRVRGVHRDPLKVKLPKSLPLEKRLRKDFLKQTAPALASLNSLSKTVVASRRN